MIVNRSFNVLKLLVFILFALVKAEEAIQARQVDVQHCKATTITRTKTVTVKATPLVVTTSGNRIKTVTQTRTVSASLGAPTVERLVGLSLFVGHSGCNPQTSRLLNQSEIGWNVLVSRGDLKAGSCNNVYWSVVPGSALVPATLALECKGKSAVLRVHSYGKWVKTCDKSTLLSGIVFPNGYNCTSRHPNYIPPYEMQLTTDVCSNKALPGPAAQAVSAPKLEFASVFNIQKVFARGIGGNNYSNIDNVANNNMFLQNGVQVMILNSAGALDTKATTPVVLSLIDQPGSSGIPWKRSPKLLGTTTVTPVMGVASFGDDLGIPTAGTYRFRACLKGTQTCALSAAIEMLPDDISAVTILKQPAKGMEFTLFNTQTQNAEFTKASGPINVTFVDEFKNQGAQADLFGNGVIDTNVTCQVATAIAPDAPGFDESTAKVVTTVTTLWQPTGYGEIWSFGKLTKAIDITFGPGTVAGALQGFRCWGTINFGAGLRDIAENTTSAITNYWIFK